ncbi:uncharacterized protein [Drosophila takahashii]|uniref:uncharacterized protein isoform X4 n=1 Tax=Drosophila takahashii TaxID=29030 RepID=UPI001CF91D51|nr:uncharacterized protein LOC108057649 isoform X3 [Drosophila takahashii]
MGLVYFLIVSALCRSAAMKPDEEKAILNKHNMYRELHGCPPLTLVESYSKDCMEYAKGKSWG